MANPELPVQDTHALPAPEEEVFGRRRRWATPAPVVWEGPKVQRAFGYASIILVIIAVGFIWLTRAFWV
jgi:hypothetical protein